MVKGFITIIMDLSTKGVFLMVKSQASALLYFLTTQEYKQFGLIITYKEKERSIIIMAITMMDSSNTLKNKGKEFIDGKIKQSIKANLKRIRSLGKAKLFFWITSIIKEEFKMAKDKASEFISIQMEMSSRENGKMT